MPSSGEICRKDKVPGFDSSCCLFGQQMEKRVMQPDQANWPVRDFVIRGWVGHYSHNSYHRLDCCSDNSYDPKRNKDKNNSIRQLRKDKKTPFGLARRILRLTGTTRVGELIGLGLRIGWGFRYAVSKPPCCGFL